MKEYLIGKIGNFYKANLHSHSTFSDGKYSPLELKKLYKNHGYSILCVTDHRTFVTHNDLTDDNFLLLSGIEVNLNENKDWPYFKTYHINFIAKNNKIEKFVEYSQGYNQENVNKLIDSCKDNFLVQYNHPHWSYQRIDEIIYLKNIWAFEVYNHGCEVESLNGWGDFEYETYCRENILDNYPCVVATDDNHNLFNENDPMTDSFGGFTIIEANKLTYEDVIEAMEKGMLYASTGPEILILTRDANKIYVKTSCCSCICLLTDARRTKTIRSNKDDITEVEFDIPDHAKTFRIEIATLNDKKALTKVYKV